MDSAVSYGEEEKRLGTPYSGRLDEIVNTKECRYSFPANQIQCKSSMNVTLPNRCSNLTNQVSNDSHRGGEEKSKNTDKTDTRKEATKGNQSYHVEVDSSDKVKTKLMSMWNNMKYGWTVKVKTNFSYESPIWLLGKCYHKKLQDEHSPESSDFATRNLSMELFKQDFSSRIWFTYRREFPSLAGSSLTTDCGWGCMLRSGQMLLAQAFICHFLYRDWQWTRSQTSRSELYHRTILRWFGDHPCVSSPFSVHQLVALGECAGKKAGDWYGPASVAHILKQSLQIASKEIPLLDTICVYVAQDCTIYQQDVYDLCSRAPQRHVSSENEIHAGDCCDEVFTQSRNSSVEISTKYFKNEQLRQVQTDAAGSSVDNRTDSRYFTNSEDCNKIYNHQNNCTKPRKIAVDGSDFELQEFHCDFKANHFGDPCLYTDNIEKAVEYSYMPDCKNKLKEMSLSNFLLETESENLLCDKSENFATYVDNISYPFHSPKSISGSCDQNTEKYCDKTRRVSHYSLSRSSSVPSPPTEEASHFPEDSVDGNMQKDGHILVESHEHSNWRRGVIILVPVRLGGDVLNRAYIPRVRNLLTQEHCIGIIGGRPRHSLYFVGWQDDKFVYLDPHYCQETVDVCTSDFPLQSFHCSVPRKMLCTKMDPSCTIGFYCKRKSDFHEFMRATEQILSPFKEKGDYPIFTIQDGKREDAANAVDAITKEQQLAQSLNYSWIQDDELETIEIDGEDFVVI